MRLMLSASPSVGNLVPVLTLGRAAASAGHQVALLTAPDMAAVADPIEILPAGPRWADLATENLRRHPEGMGDPATSANLGPAEAAEFFAATRLDLGGEQAFQVAAAWQPDVVVAEASDTFGPLVAAALHRPWCSHGFGVPLPEAFTQALRDAAAPFYRATGVQGSNPFAYLDPWPEILRPQDWPVPVDRIPIRLDPLPANSGTWTQDGPARRYILISFGTQVREPELLTAVVHSVLQHTTEPVVVTRGALETAVFDDPRVTVTGFVGLGALLSGADVVVTVGGSGTVLGALSQHIPVVVIPVFPSQRWVAQQLASHDAAVVIDEASQAGPAVNRALHDPAVRSGAHTIATQIAEMGSADDAVRAIAVRTGF